jgi:hypothetical protein
MPGEDQAGLGIRRFQGASGMAFPVVPKAANYVVPREESATTYIATAANLVFSLPPTEKGLVFTFVVAASGLSAGTGLSVSPAAVDKIMGNGLTSLDNKDAINSGATDREGDSITLEGDGVDGWYITSVIGTWAREA